MSRPVANICNSSGFFQDNIAPRAGGLNPVRKEFVYPTRFKQFNWWKELKRKECVTTIRREELPIPPIEGDFTRYPYRYTSAGPSHSGKTKKEEEMHKVLVAVLPKNTNSIPTPADVQQVKGFETTSMDASLKPFITPGERIIKASHIRPFVLDKSYAPWLGLTDFDKYIIDQLHPSWKHDPAYRRNIQFRLRRTGSDQTAESHHTKPFNPPKEKEFGQDAMSFSFDKQGPGHPV